MPLLLHTLCCPVTSNPLAHSTTGTGHTTQHRNVLHPQEASASGDCWRRHRSSKGQQVCGKVQPWTQRCTGWWGFSSRMLMGPASLFCSFCRRSTQPPELPITTLKQPHATKLDQPQAKFLSWTRINLQHITSTRHSQPSMCVHLLPLLLVC